MRLTHLSLYSGIGAMDIAATAAGLQTIALCDSEPFCRFVLKQNFRGVPIFETDTDVTKENLYKLTGLNRVDVISGGFPCQSYSLAGKQLGVADVRDRSTEYIRIIRELQPTWVLGENVRGLLSSGRLDELRTVLEDLGYETAAYCVPTGSAVGSPHRRERIIFVAYSSSARQRREKHQVCPGRNALDGCCETVADTNGAGLEGRAIRREDQSEGREAAQRSGFILAHTSSKRLQRPEPQREGDSQQQQSFDSGIGGEGEQTAAAQPRLGRDADGLSDWLDETRFPAGRGVFQYEWEPSRQTLEKQFRRQRIKALGNSAVPQAIYPFFKAIVEAERCYQELLNQTETSVT